jgi:hypothetical protein
VREGTRLIWLGGEALADDHGVQLHQIDDSVYIPCAEDEADWLVEVLAASHPTEEALDVRDAIEAFPGDWEAFADRWAQVRAVGAVVV